MSVRERLSVPLLIAFAASLASAASGTLSLHVRDGITGYNVQASVKLEGPESLTLQTDDSGSLTLSLPAGVYREEVSAPGYKVLRSHTKIRAGSNSPETFMLDPLSPPEEESREAIEARLRQGFTLLHGYVENDNSGNPLPEATVRVVNGGEQTQTDSKGHFYLSVPTPEPENPGGMGTDTLICEKTGYKTDIRQNFGIVGEAMGPVGCALEKGTGQIIHDATHKLMRGQSTGGEEPQSARPGGPGLSPELQKWLGSPARVFPVGSATSAATAQTITLPISIRVGTGGSADPTKVYQPCKSKSTCTNVYTYPLETYVSNGLPGEWMASWADDALKAGSVAYRSYAAHFAANPVCPYVGGGYNGLCTVAYDLCNTTACQNYNLPMYPPKTNSKNDVSATASVVLSSDGLSAFFAEYAGESNQADDGTATCPDGQVGEPSYNPPWPCMVDFVCKGQSRRRLIPVECARGGPSAGHPASIRPARREILVSQSSIPMAYP